MTTKLLTNQLRSIMNEPVEGFMVELVDESSLFSWKVYIEGPKDTYYEGGVFQLSLAFPKDYPMSPPTLRFVSDFWHPNVFPDGKVCMSILHPPGEDVMSGELPQERWLPTQNVTTIILSLLSLLNDPNCASPANVDASVEWRKDRSSYKKRCLQLVEKANREKPTHVVIPHPDTNEQERKRRVQKWNEMNRELDYDDFFDSGNEEEGEGEGEGEGEVEDGGEGEGEEEEENEFLESENEEINSDEAITTKNGAEKVSVNLQEEKSEKGKEKVIEIEVVKSEKKEKKSSVISIEPSNSNNKSSSSSSNNNNNNASSTSTNVPSKKSKRKNKTKKEKCIVM